jgi:cytochrome d ubiquinol oxidase subunit II
MYNHVSWETPYRGLEAALNPFNLGLGLFLVFLARSLGAMYLVNNLDHEPLTNRCRKAAWINFLLALPFLLVVLGGFITMEGFAVDPETGRVFMEKGKYLNNLLAMPAVLVLLLAGLGSVIYGVAATRFLNKDSGIWFGGIGTVLVGLAIFFLAGYHNTAFYPSAADLQSSLTIYNASSSKYTLTAMSYVALAVPFVVAYIAYVWKQMDSKKLTLAELTGEDANEMY